MDFLRIKNLVVVLNIFLAFSCQEITVSDISGTYINRGIPPNVGSAETPSKLDTLFLRPNGTFINNYWGEGRYRLMKEGMRTYIAFEYTYEFGTAGYKTSVSKFGKSIKISLNSDLNYYYRKIN